MSKISLIEGFYCPMNRLVPILLGALTVLAVIGSYSTLSNHEPVQSESSESSKAGSLNNGTVVPRYDFSTGRWIDDTTHRGNGGTPAPTAPEVQGGSNTDPSAGMQQPSSPISKDANITVH